MVRLVGEKMGGENRLKGLYIGALLHDIGKMSVPVTILTRPTNLGKEEWDLIRSHARQSYNILKEIDLPWPVAELALHHHERLDGSGYPDGISGEELCQEIRILTVCKVVEAMQSRRPYRAVRSRGEIIEEFINGRGTKYDADVVHIVLELIESGEMDFNEKP